MNNCPFCRIVEGEINATVLFEDDLVLAFLDIAPVNPGHTLLIPKEHHTSVTTVPADCLSRMITLAPKLAQHISRVEHSRGKKVIAFKMKRRKGYKRKKGHRQNFSRVRIVEITKSGDSSSSAAAKDTEPAAEE
ncbi:MAG: bL21 family ribosomal protein [Lentisphaeria bacterium]